MQKITIFHSALDGGGAERVLLNLAQGFVEKGFSVDLLLTRTEGPYLSQIPAGVNLIDLNMTSLLRSLPLLVKYLKEQQPTAIVSALEDNNLIVLWALALTRSSTQSIATVHHNLSLEVQTTQETRRKLTPYLVRLFYPWADHVVAVSQGVADDLIQMGVPDKKVNVIYNPIFTQMLLQKAEQPTDHPWLSIQSTTPVLLAVGRLTDSKDFSSLLHAFAKARCHRSIKLIILGEGEQRDALGNLAQQLDISDDVDFPGFIDNPYAYMAKADALVLSSNREGFGNVLVEAMAVGTPVISTDCPSGPTEILADGKYGQLTPVGDCDRLCKAMLETLSTPTEPEILLERAKEFSLEQSVDNYIELLALQ